MNTRKNIGIIVLVLSILFAAGGLLYRELAPGGGYQGYGYGGYGGHMMNGMMGGAGLWGMGGLMLVFWGLVLFGLILMINWLLAATRNEKRQGVECDAIQILKSRYARGEIDRGQYDQMRRELSS
ncbi:MAG: SHOCT domain-containing protein [Desulfobacterales bacterium]|nr:SHOCT domain-containing protein [Desulfobacterales bacterium]MCF8080999.1 SHOCT domain-containing protein [Desulfobacterales bacterium]